MQGILYRMNDKKLIPLWFIVSAVVGLGLSFTSWGDPEGVHGRGWPIPTDISGLPEDESSGIEIMADLGMFGFVLNIALAALTVLFLWALTRIFLRITGRG